MTVDSEHALNGAPRPRDGRAADGLEDGGTPHRRLAKEGRGGRPREVAGTRGARDQAHDLTGAIGDIRWLPAPPGPARAVEVATDPWPSERRRALGDYDLLGEIARGGVGIVYRARQRSLDRPVALKVLRDGADASPADSRRFRIEAETVARLDHPHIIPIYEVGADRGCSFFSMKLIDGGNLSERAGEYAGDHHLAARLIATVARAIHHAHERGILHRDLKPSNVLIDEDGRPQVADFGLACRVDLESDLTRTGVVLGTPAYMAPEQAGGRKADVTIATDVHGLGAILYFLLTGRPPYQGASIADRIRGNPPRAIDRAVGRDLETICLKCLEEDPSSRYASAEAVADDLERWLTGRPIRARRASRLERLWRAGRRHPGPTLASAVVILLAGAAAAGLIAGDRARRAARQFDEEARRRGSALRVERSARDVSDAGRALAVNDPARARILLRRNLPDTGETDLRGFAWHHLHRLASMGRPPLTGHDGEIFYAAFSPDGRTLATAGKDRTVRLWDPRTGATRHVLRDHGGEVNWVAFSPDGRTVATTGDDRLVRLWDVATGRPTATLAGHDGEVVSALFTGDGRLISIGRKGRVILWDADRTGIDRSFEVSNGLIQSLAASPDGRLLAITGEAVVICDLRDGRERARLETRAGRANGVAFSPDGGALAAGCRGAVLVWETRGWSLVGSTDRSSIGVESVAFSSDGKTLAWVGHDGLIHLEDRALGIRRAIPGGQGRARLWCVAFSPDGKTLATTSALGTVRIWDAERDRASVAFRVPTGVKFGSALSRDGARFVAADAVGDVWIHDARSGRLLARKRIGGPARVVSTGLTADADRLATHDASGTTALWDLETGACLRQFPPTPPGLNGLAISPDAAWIANFAFSGDTRSFVVRDASGVLRRDLRAAGEGDSLMITLARGGLCSPRRNPFQGPRLCDPHTGRAWSAPAPDDLCDICSEDFSPDGAMLATGGYRGAVTLWDTKSLEPLFRIYEAHPGAITTIAFSPDGRTLATGSSDRSVRLWDLESHRELARLEGHTADVARIDFSADGSTLATCAFAPDGRNEVILWFGAAAGPAGPHAHRPARSG